MRFVTQSVIQVGIRPFIGFEIEVIMRCPGNSLRYVVRVTCKKQILCTIDDACHTFFVTFSCYFFVSFSFSDVVKDIMMSAYRFSLLEDSIIFLILNVSLKPTIKMSECLYVYLLCYLLNQAFIRLQ